MKRYHVRSAILKALKEKGLYVETKDNPMQIPVCRYEIFYWPCNEPPMLISSRRLQQVWRHHRDYHEATMVAQPEGRCRGGQQGKRPGIGGTGRIVNGMTTVRSERRRASSRSFLKAQREIGTDGYEICRTGVSLVNCGGDIDVLLGC